MDNKTLGIIAIICAPFLYIDSLTAIQNVNSRQTGLFDFIYMTGWMCSLIALQQKQFLGRTKFAAIAFFIPITLLSLAQVWNIWIMIAPSSGGTLFRILDSCWPLSNTWMLVTGITALAAKQLAGWKRFMPLVAGLWLPLTAIIFMAKLPM